MEIKLSPTQVVITIIQTIAYIGTIFVVAYKIGEKITKIEAHIKQTANKLDEHIDNVTKVFDKIDSRLWESRGKDRDRI